MNICVIANNEEVALCLLRFLRIIIDDDIELLWSTLEHVLIEDGS